MKILRYLIIVLILSGVVLFGTKKEEQASSAPRSYREIIQSGELRAVTEYNAISFHAKGDTVEGFDYEILQAFARDKGLRLSLTPEMSFERRMEGTESGKYDLLATSTIITTDLKDSLLFTRTLILDKQILIQRKNKESDSLFIHNQLELAHKTLYVTKGSPALLRIHNLINEIADTIYIKEVEKYGAEQLMAMVAGGDIDYAVCDESLARASIGSYPELDISTDIGFTQFYAWGVSKRNSELRDSLNTWLEAFQESKEYKKIYNKYFHN